MVSIILQSWWSFRRNKEIYHCDFPSHVAHPLQQAAMFCKRSPVRSLTVGPNDLKVSRGSIFGSLFSFNELHHRHELLIKIAHGADGGYVICEYQFLNPYPTVHLPPRRAWQEVQQLEDFLREPRKAGNFVGGDAKDSRGKPQATGNFIGRFVFKLFYRLFRFFSWIQYQGARRFTRGGVLALVALVAAGMMGLDTDNTVTYQAFTPIFFLLFIAIVSSWFFRARFSATRLLPRFGTVGRPFSYSVRVKNLSKKNQSGLTLFENLADPRPAFDEWLAAQLADERRVRSFKFSQPRSNRAFRQAAVREAALPPMRPNGEAEARLEIIPLRRGVIRFNGVTLARPDPLGLFRSFVKAPAPQAVLVLPRRYPMPHVALPGTMKYQEGGVAMAANIGRSDEFVALRDYRRGDPLRHIHWRSWAKTGKPIVKEFEDEFFTRHALVLDTFTDDPRGEEFEEAVSVAASFACTIQTQESLLDLLFVGQQAYCFTSGRGLAHADQMLEILASVRTCPDRAFESLEHLVLDHAGAVSGCIFVLLAWDEARRELVRKLKMLGVPVLVLVIIESGSGPTLAPGPMRDEPEKFHVLEAGRIEEGLGRL